MEPFKEQEDNVWKLKQGNLANVSAHYRKTCCKGVLSLHQFVGNLRKEAGVSKEDTVARNKYKEASTRFCRSSDFSPYYILLALK
jgi:hypothetical protein